MAKKDFPATVASNLPTQPTDEPTGSRLPVRRRSFLKGLGFAGATISAGTLLATQLRAEEHGGRLRRGDAAILRFLAAAEIIETDLWQQYNELAGIQDNEVPGGSGSDLYALALAQLDEDMDQYIHDNTEDELTHEVFINAYLASKGADTVNLDKFRTLPSSKATGAQQIGRLTNLMQLTVDTSWFTRYRSRTKNPDFGDTFPHAIPTLAVGQHPAIPRTDDDVKPDPSKPNNISDFTQAIANTAGFHFAFIEQGGASLYPTLAFKATDPTVLRILVSIGGVEIDHFGLWHDKGGNAVAQPLAGVVDPVTGLTFPDLNNPATELTQTNKILPEPCDFISKNLPRCSVIRPTSTQNGGAVATVKAFTDDGLFIGQPDEFLDLSMELAVAADSVKRGF